MVVIIYMTITMITIMEILIMRIYEVADKNSPDKTYQCLPCKEKKKKELYSCHHSTRWYHNQINVDSEKCKIKNITVWQDRQVLHFVPVQPTITSTIYIGPRVCQVSILMLNQTVEDSVFSSTKGSEDADFWDHQCCDGFLETEIHEA